MTRSYLENRQLYYSQETGSTILIVDDIQNNIDLLEEILEDENYTFITVKKGTDVAKVTLENMPDIILLDIMLPDISGFEVLKTIKNYPQIRDIPVIFITAKGNSESVIEGLRLGAVDYISKPFHIDETRLRVRNHINLKKALNHERDLIEEIQGGIEYAGRLQKAIFPGLNTLNEYYPDNFVFHKPKDIVSGDFYWFTKFDNDIYIAVADCTGHGVPGAFMSLLGITYLNDITSDNNIKKDTSTILDELRNKIMTSLKHSFDEDNPNDGMDIAIIRINKNSDTISFSGAFNSIYIVRNEELSEYRGDRMPVGLYYRESRPFTLKEIQVFKGDMIYLFTDGYIDQFGGKKGKKYRTKHFKQILKNISILPLKQQKKSLEEDINNWMEGFEQIDDILIVGIQV